MLRGIRQISDEEERDHQDDRNKRIYHFHIDQPVHFFAPLLALSDATQRLSSPVFWSAAESVSVCNDLLEHCPGSFYSRKFQSDWVPRYFAIRQICCFD